MGVMDEVAKQVRIAVSKENLSLSLPLWVLVVVIGTVGYQAERRITNLERRMQWTQLVLRSKFPTTTGMVDRVFEEEEIRGNEPEEPH